MYEVILTTRAQREYRKLAKADLERIDDSLNLLKTDPRPFGVKKIRKNIHRIRKGDWRIIYAIYDKDRLVLVGWIARRTEDTYSNVENFF